MPNLSELAAQLRAAGCVYAEEEARLLLAAATSESVLAGLVDRRLRGTPLEHVLGWAEFCGQRMVVAPGVFVPRRRTELLVRLAAPMLDAGDVVVDLCCGTGAVGAALAAAVPGLEVYAVDSSPAACRCAHANLPCGTVLHGDLFTPLPRSLRGRVAAVVVNAPYVPTAEIPLMPPEAREHEPVRALDGGADGVEVHRRIAAGVGAWLAPHGHLLVETSGRQSALTCAALEQRGLSTRVVSDPGLAATAVVGTQRSAVS